MIGLNTIVIVRYIMQDDARQSRLASTLIEKLTVDKPGFVPLVAVIELVWVLSSSFEPARVQITSALKTLLQTKEIQIERAEVVWRALRICRKGFGRLRRLHDRKIGSSRVPSHHDV